MHEAAIEGLRFRVSAAAGIAAGLALLALGGCGSGSSAPSGKGAPGGKGASGGIGAHGAGDALAAGAGALPTPLGSRRRVTLILDFTPNAVHAGIYRALAEGLYAKENIDLEVISPSETSDTLALIDAGRADFGLADGSDIATEISRGGDAEAVMAIAQPPLGGLIARASEHLSSPAQLQGRTVGITGVPSDTAVLDTEVQAAGGNPRRVHVVRVGFDGAQALRADKIAAFTGFWAADGVGLLLSGVPITTFKLNDWGGPDYPGLVAFTTTHMIASDPQLVRDFVAATVRGYEETERNPTASLDDLLERNPTLSSKLQSASLSAYLPLFSPAGVPFGKLRASAISSLSRWMVSHGLVRKQIPFGRYGTDRFLPSASSGLAEHGAPARPGGRHRG